MIDEHLFWSLQGPGSFIGEIVRNAATHGIVAVQAPLYHPPGLLAALERALEEEGISPVYKTRGDHGASVLNRLASAAGEYRQGIRTVGALLDSPSLRGSVFVVPAISNRDWTNWTSFLRTFQMERRRRKGAYLLPVIVAVVPSDCPVSDVERLFGTSVVRWRGRVSSFDMRTYVAARTGRTHGDSLLTSAASHLVVGLSGYDPILAEFLFKLDPVSLIDPWDKLRAAYSSTEAVHPHWGNGLVDLFDAEPFEHTSSLVMSNNRKDFDVRRWRAVSGPVLDFNAKACRHFADVHAAVLETRLPWKVETAFGVNMVRHRYDMENKHLRECLHDVFEKRDDTFLRATNKARNHIAHNEVPEASLLQTITTVWSQLHPHGPTGKTAWDWPRCEQCLVLLVGPAGAGKSTYALANFSGDEVISSDALRTELFGSQIAPGSQARVFELVRERAVSRLRRGETAVIDATNLKQRDRLTLVDVMPVDMKITYIVLDRSMEEKVRDGGWRNGRDGLLEGHAATFALELDSILRGDGRPNVNVVDARQSNEGSSAVSP